MAVLMDLPGVVSVGPFRPGLVSACWRSCVVPDASASLSPCGFEGSCHIAMWHRCRLSISTRPSCGTRHAFIRKRRSAWLTYGRSWLPQLISCERWNLRFALSLSARTLTVTGRGLAPVRPCNTCYCGRRASRASPHPGPLKRRPWLCWRFSRRLRPPAPSRLGPQAGKRPRMLPHPSRRPGGRVGLRLHYGALGVSAFWLRPTESA